MFIESDDKKPSSKIDEHVEIDKVEPKKYLTLLQKKILVLKLRNSKPPQYILDIMNSKKND